MSISGRSLLAHHHLSFRQFAKACNALMKVLTGCLDEERAVIILELEGKPLAFFRAFLRRVRKEQGVDISELGREAIHEYVMELDRMLCEGVDRVAGYPTEATARRREELMRVPIPLS